MDSNFPYLPLGKGIFSALKTVWWIMIKKEVLVLSVRAVKRLSSNLVMSFITTLLSGIVKNKSTPIYKCLIKSSNRDQYMLSKK